MIKIIQVGKYVKFQNNKLTLSILLASDFLFSTSLIAELLALSFFGVVINFGLFKGGITGM